MKIKVTMTRSAICTLKKQRQNLASLGLTKIGSSRIHEDTPAIRGMIKVVSHLIKVEEVTE